jgi:hypothetical protein
VLLACALALPSPDRASAADVPSAKIQQFIDLLADPEVRAWIAENAAKPSHPAAAVQPAADAPPADAPGTMPDAMSERVGSWRDQLVAFTGAVQALPSDLATTWSTLLHKINRHHAAAKLIALMIFFIGLGYGAQRLYFFAIRPAYRWLISGPTQVLVAERLRIVLLRFALGLGLIGSFALGSIGSFLLVDWPTGASSLPICSPLSASSSPRPSVSSSCRRLRRRGRSPTIIESCRSTAERPAFGTRACSASPPGSRSAWSPSSFWPPSV